MQRTAPAFGTGRRWHVLFCLFVSLFPGVSSLGLTIPAFTAYALPDPEGLRISPRAGVSRWTNALITVHWFGLFKTNGVLQARVLLRLPEGAESRFTLALGNQTNRVSVRGQGQSSPVSADFGSFSLETPGYHAARLSALDASPSSAPTIDSLILEGPATENAHFNLDERRNAASVHLNYPVPAGSNIAAFYSEVTAIEDPTSTFYMACGWHRGYFGMQVNGPTERRIIFSVWDSGNEGQDRNKVAPENRVQLMGKGDGVYSGDFGNEGTGGHSHLKYYWKTGQPQRFLVTAQPTNGTYTIFSGYFFHPDSKAWMLISSWKAPKEGGWLRRLHGFSENFWGSNGHLNRKALFGSQWIRTDAGQWTELTSATFSHDPTGKSHRLDRFMGIENGQFFLSHGGFREGFTAYGERFERPETATLPPNLSVIPPPR